MMILFTVIAVISLATRDNPNTKQINSKKTTVSAVNKPVKKSTPKFSDTPTLFFHGLLSSYKSEKYLVNYAKKSGITNSVTRVNVDRNGKVKLIGRIKKNAVNPVIEVNYEDNFQINFAQNGVYATKVVKALQKKYGIKRINMVGHSLGNMSIIYYQMKNGNNANMPRLTKQVDIAGHFNGANFKQLPAQYRNPHGLTVDINGKPNKMNATYKQMLDVRKIYQKHPVSVLNIYGDTGNNSDGVVKNVSSMSLHYLVADSPYRELKYTGYYAEHGRLTNNSQVAQAIIQFLW